jgi:probable HAF family extracellular repeat protein
MFPLSLFQGIHPQRSPRSRPHRFRPRLEHLEDRRVPSTITDLGILPGGTLSYAYKINTLGQAVGYADTADGKQHGVLFSDGGLQDLGTLGTGKTSNAYGINDLGQIVGYSTTAPQGTQEGAQHAFYYDGTMHDMGTLGGDTSDAWNINNAGQVIGYSDTVPNFGIPHAFLWDTVNGFQDLGTLGGAVSYGYGINESGDATGSAETADGFLHAFVYSNGVMNDIGTLPDGNYSQGWAINEVGDVAGVATANGNANYHAFLYRDATMTDLGTLGGDNSIAYSVNNNGDVVGTAETTPGHPAANPFLYRDGVMTNVKDFLPPNSGWNLLDARYITDNDLIVGVGRHGSSGTYHGFILDLDAPDPATVTASATAFQSPPGRPHALLPDGLSTSSLSVKPLAVTTVATAAVPSALLETGGNPYFVVHSSDVSTGGALGGDLGTEGMFNSLS